MADSEPIWNLDLSDPNQCLSAAREAADLPPTQLFEKYYQGPPFSSPSEQAERLNDFLRTLLQVCAERVTAAENETEPLREQLSKTQADFSKANVEARQARQLQQTLAKKTQECEALRRELEEAGDSAPSGQSEELAAAKARIKQLEQRVKEQEKRGGSSKAGEDDAYRKVMGRIPDMNRAAVKIQARIRGFLCRRRFFQMVEQYVRSSRKISKKELSNETIMKQVTAAAKSRNLTLEQCYRAADSNGDGLVGIEELVHFMTQMKLGLTSAQISRLMLILDEDCSGQIEQQEFYDALSAYQVASEYQRAGTRSYAQETLLKFVSVLSGRGISPEELFSLCDAGGDGTIDTGELERFVSGLKMGFKEKEVHALMTLLDADHTSTLSLEEFSKHMDRGQQAYKLQSAMSSSPSKRKINTWVQDEDSQGNEEIKAIVRKMESKGVALSDAFDKLESDKKGRVTMAGLSRFMNTWFPQLTKEEILRISMSLDLDKDAMLDAGELHQFLATYSQSPKPSLRSTLSLMAQVVQKKKVKIAGFASKAGITGELPKDEFTAKVIAAFGISPDQADLVATSLDLKSTNFIAARDFVAVLKTYRTDGEEEEAGLFEVEEVKGLESAPNPRANAEQAIREFENYLTENKLQPLHVYKLANKRNLASIATVELQTAITKLLPGAPDRLVEKFLKSIPENSISRDEFLALFEPPAPKQQAAVPAAAFKDNMGFNPEQIYWLKRLDEAMKTQGETPAQVFQVADLDHDDKISLKELGAALKRMIPSVDIPPEDLPKVLAALDVNKNQVLEKQEFLLRLQHVKRSNMPQDKVDEYERSLAQRSRTPIEEPETAPTKPVPKPAVKASTAKSAAKPQPALSFSASPLPIRTCVKAPKLTQLIQKFQKTLTAGVDSTLTSTRLESLFNLHRFIQCYSVRGGLSETDCMEVFKALDTHSQNVIPHYVFLTVLNSYQKATDFAGFPIAQNEDCEADIRLAWSRLIPSKEVFDATEVFQSLPLDSDLMAEWDGLLVKWGVAEAQRNLLQASLSALSQPYVYHAAAILSSYCDSILLDPGEVLYEGIFMAEMVGETCDFFAQHNISPIDIMDHDQFLERVAPVMNWNSIETEAVYNAVFGPETYPIYHFFTALDLYRSTLERGLPTRPLPSLPVKDSKKPAKTLAVVEKVALAMGGPITRFGVQFDSKLTDQELGLLLIKATAISQPEAQVILREVKIPPAKTTTVYHLLTVLDSFQMQQLAVELPKDAVQMLAKQLGRGQSGMAFLMSKGLQMGAILHPGELQQSVKLADTHSEALFAYIDAGKKGTIYAFEVAAQIDIFQTFRGNLGSFPLVQNPSTPMQLRTSLTHLTANFAGQHSFDIYIKRGNIQIDSRIDRPTAAKLFRKELSSEEIELLFDSLKLGTVNEIVAYHFLACLESYSTVAAAEEEPMMMEEAEEEESAAPSLKQAEVFQVVQRIPEQAITATYYEGKGIRLDQMFDQRSWAAALQRAEKLSREACEQLFLELDQAGKGKLFGYQFLTYIDLQRSCFSGGELAYSQPELPFAAKRHLTLSAPLKAVAQELDRNSTPTLGFLTRAGLQPTQQLPLVAFTKLLGRMDPARVKALFTELAFTQKSAILAYHFLAVLETYREVAPAGTEASGPSPSPARDLTPAREAAAPMQPSSGDSKEAFQKLADYFTGANPKRKPLTPAEVFAPFDSNRDGRLTRAEFLRALSSTKLNLTDPQLLALQKQADLDKSDAIMYTDFVQWLLDSVPSRVQAAPSRPSAPVQAPAAKKPRRPVSDIRGLEVPYASLPEGSFDQAVHKMKQYVRSNAGSFAAIEEVFGQLDTDHMGSLGETEFYLAMERLKITLSNSQKALLKNKADSNKDGRINYTEFLAFVYEYEFTGGPLEESKASEAESNSLIHRTMTKRESTTNDPVEDIENYQIDPQKDFFRKANRQCTTILNNELSVLKRCVELVKAARGKPFKDVEFGPEYGPKSLYWKGTPPNSNFPPWEDLSWKSPRDWMDSVSFTSGNIASNDVEQGALGDCWFIGALSVLATRDELVCGSIKELNTAEQVTAETVPGISKGVYPPLFHPFAAKGLYVFRFFKDASWRYVIVDERLPVFEGNGEPQFVFGRCREAGELWVPLLEKAYAKLHGCYEALGGGLIDDALVDMTGLVSYKVKLTGKGGYFEVPPAQQGPLADQLWDQLMNFKKNGTLMGCSADGGGVESDIMIHGENTGLLARHAYGIVDMLYVVNPKAHNTKKRHRLLRVRNPWGNREWTGKWSDDSPEMAEFGEAVNKELQKSGDVDEDIDLKNKDDGTFFMCFKDWRTIFDNFYACVDFEDSWSGVRFEDEWTKSTSGGVPTSPSQAAAKLFSKNPQFTLNLRRKTDLYFALQQNEGRYQPDSVFPYQGFIYAACISVMTLKPNEDGVESFDSVKIVKLSQLKMHREVTLRLELDPGKYSIVPATMNSGETAQFWLSIYFSCAKDEIVLSKRGSPEIKGNMIAEEEEVDPASISEDIVTDLRKMVSYLIAL